MLDDGRSVRRGEVAQLTVQVGGVGDELERTIF